MRRGFTYQPHRRVHAGDGRGGMVFIIRRVLQSLVVVLVMSLVVFVGVHLVGDPVHI